MRDWIGGVGMSERGFSAIGLVRPKNAENIGHVLRAAYCYRASLVAVQGDRTPIRSYIDTPKAWRHIPVIRGENLHEMIPFDAMPIAVDIVPDAIELPAFQHPQRAFYIFGPEDGTLGSSVLDWCADRVLIPTRHCLNLGMTVNVVLYDRMAKHNRMTRGISYKSLAQREKQE